MAERRTAHAKTFDVRSYPGSSLADLALDLFLINYRTQAIAPEILAENHRNNAIQLASLRFFDLSRNCPTNAGILLFAKDPLYWLPGSYIQFVRVDGNSWNDPIKNERKIVGDLLTVLRELDILLDVQITQHLIQNSNLREKIVMDYPLIALREILMNAVMHRQYDSNSPIRFYWFNDRIEIQSPGGLYGEASEANFPNQNAYRNPVIAEAMKILGYVNKFGRGVWRARAALEENQSPPIDFQFDANYVLATIWRRV